MQAIAEIGEESIANNDTEILLTTEVKVYVPMSIATQEHYALYEYDIRNIAINNRLLDVF